MDLRHQFTVPTAIAQTWAHFQDLESLAQCFPGATITSVEDNSFAGSAKIKLGPIALVYAGTGTITERDETGHRMVVDAKGKDKRGNGTAGAVVTLTMSESGENTEVEVVTELNVTGKPAQFGRGVMQDVSDKLLGQFVSCLEQRLTGSDAEQASEVGPATAGAERAGSGAGVEPGVGAGVESSSGVISSGSPATANGADRSVGGPTARPGVRPSVEPNVDSSLSPRTSPRPLAAAPAAGSDDAIDFGATVLPVLVKSYWKQVLAVVGGLWLLRQFVRRH